MRLISYLLLLMTWAPVWAQDLVPATSEDIQEFDRQVSMKMKHTNPSHSKISNFGKTVSAEAHKLNDQGRDQGNDFGQWVSGQRSKSDQGMPSSGSGGDAGGNGNGNGNGNGMMDGSHNSPGPANGGGKGKKSN